MVACSPVADGAWGVAVRVAGCCSYDETAGVLGRTGSGVEGVAAPEPGVFGFHMRFLSFLSA